MPPGYIPGHGFIDDAAIMKRELDEARQALVYVIDEAKRLHAAGLRLRIWPRTVRPPNTRTGARMATGHCASSQAPLAIARVYLELDGKLPETLSVGAASWNYMGVGDAVQSAPADSLVMYLRNSG